MKSIFIALFCVLNLPTAFAAEGSLMNQSDETPEQRILKVENEIFPGAMLKGQEPSPQTILQRMRQYKVPGVSIAIINQGRIEWARGYGIIDANTNSKVLPNTLFQAASISKPVAAVAALQLVETKKLTLDDNASDFLKTWSIRENEFTKKSPVTLRRLLSHTAGFNVHGFGGYAAGQPFPTVVQILDGLPPANSQAIDVEVTPGTEFRYSGGGYTVMQQMVRDTLGRDLANYANENVLEKAGMNNSTFTQPLPSNLWSNAASGHLEDGSVVEGKWHTYPEVAAAGLWTTATDLAKFAMEIQNDKASKLLSKQMIQQYLSPTSFQDYGLGIGLIGSEENLKFWHNGGNEGFRCLMTAYAHKGVGAVVMTNGDGGSFLTTEIQSAIARAYGWTDFQPQTYEPLANQEPEIKVIINNGLKFLADGQIDKEHFSAEFQKKLNSDMLEQYKWLLGDLGGAESIVLVKRQDIGSLKTYDYWVKFDNAVALLHAKVTVKQQLDGLTIDNIFHTGSYN